VTALTDALDTGLIPVGVGTKPANVGTGAYIVIWPDVPTRAPSTMKLTSAYVETWTAHCYGRTPDAAGVAFDALSAAVYALWNTTVDGRTVQYPEQLTALPLSVDRDADPDIYDYAIEWRFRTSA
jgi:hypothetical protein